MPGSETKKKPLPKKGDSRTQPSSSSNTGLNLNTAAGGAMDYGTITGQIAYGLGGSDLNTLDQNGGYVLGNQDTYVPNTAARADGINMGVHGIAHRHMTLGEAMQTFMQMGPDAIRTLQGKLQAAGYYDGISGYKPGDQTPGVLDNLTRIALRELLGDGVNAAMQGKTIDDLLQERINHKLQQAGTTDLARGDGQVNTVHLTSATDIRSIARSIYQKEIGRDPTEAELTAIVGEQQGQERSAQQGPIDAQIAANQGYDAAKGQALSGSTAGGTTVNPDGTVTQNGAPANPNPAQLKQAGNAPAAGEANAPADPNQPNGPTAGAPATSFPVAGPHNFTDTWGAGRADLPGGKHQGNDIFAKVGTPVVAVEPGVVHISHNTLGGNTVWLQGDSGTWYYYAHLSTQAVGLDGHHVGSGIVVGAVGMTGDAASLPASASHLHFEIHPGGRGAGAVDPYGQLSAWDQGKNGVNFVTSPGSNEPDGSTTITNTDQPNPSSTVEEQLRQQHPEEVMGHNFADAYNSFVGLLSGSATSGSAIQV